MKQIYLLSFLLFAALSVFSQGPKKAIGIRGGFSSGFEYRVFSGDLSSYKVLLSSRLFGQGMQLTGLKEFHIPDVFDINEEMSFVYGLGAHVGFESWKVNYLNDVYPYNIYVDRKFGPIAGLDGLAALEYTVPEFPFVVGFEVKPYFNLFGKNFVQFQPFDFAFTVKYTF